jgi:hypothetical protein
VGGALLVADQDVFELRMLVQVLVDRQVGAARVAEYVFDSLALQRLQDHVRSGQLVSSTPLKMKKPPTSRSGAFAIYSVVWLAVACPRSSEANKAQESKEEYEAARRTNHRTLNTNDRTRLRVVSEPQISATGFA